MIQIDQKEIDETVNQCGGLVKTIITIEECSELQKALTKMLRAMGDENYTFADVCRADISDPTYVGIKYKIDDVIEESADVLICIEYIKKIFGITDDDINKVIKQKQERQKQRDKNSETARRWACPHD